MADKQRLLTERDLRSLRVFCAVAQAGGFSGAERQLNMSKASISRHVREVEERLGVRLCERGPAGFKLTTAGTVALDVSLNALRTLEKIRPEIDAVRGVLSGAVTIGMVEHVLTDPLCQLPEALAELKRRAPNIRPEILVMTHAQLNLALRERRVQLGIRGQYKKDRVFNYQPLFVENHKFYVSAQVSETQAADMPLVYRFHPFIDEAIGANRFKRGPDAGGLEAIAVLVATGSYVGLLPEHYAGLVRKRYPLRELKASPTFHNTICAITEASRPLPASIELLLEIMRELSLSVTPAKRK
ncbi:MAG: LysR family transcriptional regulator [Candidimonas sp.]|nr:MAG: LysR family transcriptional regulator [Candidimonas sp.]TAM19476.1 MAG: LysR family transcriptional regulator [Candidimonas sp.]